MQKAKERKILVTSALPYVNNVPHLGTMVCIISADVYTRFLRLKEEKVISVLGTDEHGTTTEVKAMEEGLTPKEICDKYSKIQKEIYDWLLCDFDCWGRTSSNENKQITIEIFTKLKKNNFIIEKEIEQFYCNKCNKFLADRFIQGNCPSCGYDKAKGDQCEKCGKLLNPEELINPKCKIDYTTPVLKKTKHLFIDLPKIEPLLRKWMKKVEKKWSENARTMTYAWLKEGLKPRCITRDLKWGIPVPDMPGKVFYSWFDAPIGYIGITIENREDWKEWWLNPKEVRLVQFMGKDNIPFHTILFPSFLLGTGDNYTLVDTLSVNEYLTYEGGKFSKSENLGIFGDEISKLEIRPDVWRYYIIINRPEKSDTDFIWSDFQQKINNELVANFGNLVNRVITFINNNYNGIVPEGEIQLDNREYFEEIENLLEDIRLKEALRHIMQFSKSLNQYFQEQEPWKNIKENKKKTDNAMFTLINSVKDLAILVYPFMPGVAMEIYEQLNIKPLHWKDLGKPTIRENHKINKPKILFQKLENMRLNQLKDIFSGKTKREEEKISIADLDLRVAKIIEVKNHPKADKLYVLDIDLNYEKRQLVAGLREYYKIAELKGKKIVIVANLKPATLRGIESKGMLLAAEDPKNNIVELVDPGDAEVGEQIVAENTKMHPRKEISIEEFAKINLEVSKEKFIVSDNKKLMTKEGILFVRKAKEGSKVR